MELLIQKDSKNTIETSTYSHEPLIVALSQVNELISFLRRFLDFLLSLLVLHLEHADTIPQQFHVVLDSEQTQGKHHGECCHI